MPVLINESPFSAILLPGWGLDRSFQSTLTVKVTCDFDLSGQLKLAEEQPELVLADSYRGDPATSSLKQTCETVPFKNNAEFYLYGKAYPQKADATLVTTSTQLQGEGWAVEKTLLVLGDHQWQRGLSGITRSKIANLEPTELHYELAYGGIDEKTSEYFSSNPAGCGYNPSSWRVNDIRAPQIEYEDTFKAHLNRHNRPAGYGPIPPNWLPRATRYGRVPTAQELNRTLCPWGEGVDPRAHHCAPDDQQLPTFLLGGEKLYLKGFFADGVQGVNLQLPNWTSQVHYLKEQAPPTLLNSVCDTLVIDTEQRQLSLIYRTALPADGLLSSQEGRWLLIPESFGPTFREDSC